MADLADFVYPPAAGYVSVTGTVTATSTWVHAVGTMTLNSALVAYGRIAVDGTPIDLAAPGYALIPFYCLPFIRLPNPPYGAKIIYANNPTAPNAMTELDDSYIGVVRDADFPDNGKYLYSQMRSSMFHWSGSEGGAGAPPDTGYTTMELGANATMEPYTWETIAPWLTNPDWIPYGAAPMWIRGESETLSRNERGYSLAVVSRGPDTWIVVPSQALGPPGAIIDFDLMWWNGPGFRCSDAQLVMVD
jgi:hypothetical protein